MKFDFVIGNPPYQEEVSEGENNTALAKQLFPFFIQESVKQANDSVVLVTPARWFAGDAQDKSFVKLREFLRENNHISSLVYYPDGKDVFPGVTIKGGVCYFTYQMDHKGDVRFTTVEDQGTVTLSRPLFEEGLDIVITDPVKISVLLKVQKKTTKYLTDITKGRNAFGIIGKEDIVESISSKSPFDGCCILRLKSDEIRYIQENAVTKSIDVFNSYKVFISKSAGAPNTDHKIIGKAYIGEPKSACTDSLIPIGCFPNKEAACCLQKYLATKFLRYLVSIMKVSQNVTQIVYKFVPLQDFTSGSDVIWSKSVPEIDQQLYRKYNLSDEEIAFIESHVKEME